MKTFTCSGRVSRHTGAGLTQPRTVGPGVAVSSSPRQGTLERLRLSAHVKIDAHALGTWTPALSRKREVFCPTLGRSRPSPLTAAGKHAPATQDRVGSFRGWGVPHGGRSQEPSEGSAQPTGLPRPHGVSVTGPWSNDHDCTPLAAAAVPGRTAETSPRPASPVWAVARWVSDVCGSPMET